MKAAPVALLADTPRAVPALPAEEVHLWWMNNAPDQLTRCRLLADYAGVAPASLAFAAGPFGKPALTAPPQAAGLHFSVSRSGGVAVLAVARGGRVGVDVAALRPVPEAALIARRLFSPAEAAALAALPDTARLAGFYRLWTCKEAVVKALGGGLSIPLDAFEVEHRADHPPALRSWRLPGGGQQPVRLLPVPAMPGHALALAADAPIQRCRLFHWPAAG